MRRPGPIAVGALGTYLIMLGATLPYPILEGFVQERLGVGEIAASLYVTVNLGAYVLLAPLVGRLVDRGVSPRGLVAVGLVGQAALLGIQPAVDAIAPLLVVRFLEGVATITALTALHATVLSARQTGAVGPLAGSIGLGLAFGVASGSALGGVLGDQALALPFWLGAGLLALGALVLAPLVTARRVPSMGPGGHASPWRMLDEDPRLWVPTGFSFVDRLTVGFLVTALPLTLGDLHGFSPTLIGAAMTVFLVAFGIGQIPAGRLSDRVGRWLPIAGGSLVYGAAVLALPHLTGPWLWTTLALGGLAGAVMFASSLALTRDLAPEATGSSVALFHQAGSLGFAIGPLAAGALVAGLGAAGAFAIAGAVEALAVALLALLGRHHLDAVRGQNSVNTMTP